tara:strand:- start:30 stop:293 length:264 start_codon:yes stop_codon:yes gene_type:complete
MNNKETFDTYAMQPHQNFTTPSALPSEPISRGPEEDNLDFILRDLSHIDAYCLGNVIWDLEGTPDPSDNSTRMMYKYQNLKKKNSIK